MKIFPSRDSLPVVKYGHTLYHVVGIRPQSRTNQDESEGLYFELRHTNAEPSSPPTHRDIHESLIIPYIEPQEEYIMVQTATGAAMRAYHSPKLAVNNVDVLA